MLGELSVIPEMQFPHIDRAAYGLFVMQPVSYVNTKNYEVSMSEWANREVTPSDV